MNHAFENDMTDANHLSRTPIANLLDAPATGQTYKVCGWVRTFRNDRFLAVNDGSTLHNLQWVVDKDHTPTTSSRSSTQARPCKRWAC